MVLWDQSRGPLRGEGASSALGAPRPPRLSGGGLGDPKAKEAPSLREGASPLWDPRGPLR